MIYKVPICYDCKNYYMETGTCKAFPKRIPVKIYLGSNKHAKPLPNQKNDIVFEQKEGPDGPKWKA